MSNEKEVHVITEIIEISLHDRIRFALTQLLIAWAHGLIAVIMAPISALSIFFTTKKEIQRQVGPDFFQPPVQRVEHTVNHNLSGGDDNETWLKEHRREYGEDDEDSDS